MFSIGATFFRHNGLLNLFIFPIVIGQGLRKISSKVTFGLISSYLIAFIIFYSGIPRILQVEPSPSWLTQLTIYMESVSYLQEHPFGRTIPRLSTKTQELLAKVAPKEFLLKNYDPLYVNYILFPDQINKGAMTDEFIKDLTKEFFTHNLPTNLNFFIGNRVTLFASATLGYANTAELGIAKNNLGLKTNPISSTLNKLLYQIAGESMTATIFRFFVWNALLIILFLLFAFVDSLYKKNTPLRFFSSVLLINIAFLAMLVPAADWRYFYFAYLSIFIAIPIWLTKDLSQNTLH